MKKLLILLSIFVAGFNLSAQQDTIQKAITDTENHTAESVTPAQYTLEDAATAYSQGQYNKSAEIYEQLLKTKGESSEIYYNIGNCYYKLNKTASAILNYERALLLSPGDGDTRFNLEVAKLKTTDRINPVGNFFLVDWFQAIQNTFSTNQWSYIGIICFILFIGCLILFFFSRKILMKKAGFYVGIGLLVITISSNIFSYNQKKKLTNRNTAIILASTVTIKSSPDNSGTDLFVLHEGVKVEIKSKLGGWSEIEIADGNVGWIKSDDIEII